MIIPLSFKSIMQPTYVDIRLSRSFFPLVCIIFTLAFSLFGSGKVIAQDNPLPNHLTDKFYRQALYFYFQNKPKEAIRQLDINQDYFSQTPVHETLFRAGLQISQGLHKNAQKLLVELSTTSDDDFSMQASEHQRIQNNLNKEALKFIVLLQLIEQKIAEHNLLAAKEIIAKIRLIPEYYLGHYYVMQQLIAWPKQPDIESFSLTNTSKKQLKNLISNHKSNIELQEKSTAYILLNEALSAMNQKEFSLAEKKLKRLQLFTWQGETEGFWQQLFSNENKPIDTLANSKKIEQKGISHYAQLLLAQLYIEQGLFQQGYQQLESFPKNTPFTEHALFLYGYSAFKLEQYKVSEVILNTLITQYPYGNYTQQAWLLSAEQYTAQSQLNNALNRYLQIEKYYQTKQQALSAFTNTLGEQKELLPLYQLLNEKKVGEIDSNTVLWLTSSLRDRNIATLYQQLQSIELLTKQLQEHLNKSRWLATTIELNKTRQNSIRELNKNSEPLLVLNQLNEKRSQLAALLTKAKYLGNGELFANKAEKKLLARIEKSQNILVFIEEHKQENRTTVSYQQRLSRVQGVLAWQLQQTFSNRYWQTRKSLNEFERSYENTLKQHKKVNQLLSNQGSFIKETEKQGMLNDKITELLNKTSQIKSQINTSLLNKMTFFIENEHSKIEQFLLFNQRAMASVIEKLNRQEAL
jgi:hypothetical protein